MENSSSSGVRPDFSSTMTQHVWTEVGVNRADQTADYINTIYRPGRPWKIRVWGSTCLPEFSRAMQ